MDSCLYRTVQQSHPAKSSFSFFFYLSADHPDLPSFPTRRSSDLTALYAAYTSKQPLTTQALLDALKATVPRSEEHTSELQSLRHLVCRLLLEKKKLNMF